MRILIWINMSVHQCNFFNLISIILCLQQVPRSEHCKLLLVCKRWNRLLSGSYYYSLRKSLGIAEDWLYVIKQDREGKISWNAFDPIHQLWQRLPPIPREYAVVRGFGCAVLGGSHLYLFGGEDPHRGLMRRVVYYSARTNKWRRAPDMPRRRHLFGSCVINNCLYIAGGENEGVQGLLRTGEVYDPSKSRWSFISELGQGMLPSMGVVYKGEWYLKGHGEDQEVLSEAYQPETDTWRPVHGGIVSGWRSPSTTLNGQFYAVDCRDGCRIHAFDEMSGAWAKHMDSKAHMGSSPALEAAALVPLNGKLCIVRNNMSISLVDVSGFEREAGPNPQDFWENIGGKGQFKTMVTNLWSSLSGRNGLKSHIVHCQVLQA